VATAGRHSGARLTAAHGMHSERRRLQATSAEPQRKTLQYPEKTSHPHTCELSSSICNFPLWREANQLSSYLTKRTLSSSCHATFLRRRTASRTAVPPLWPTAATGLPRSSNDINKQAICNSK